MTKESQKSTVIIAAKVVRHTGQEGAAAPAGMAAGALALFVFFQ